MVTATRQKPHREDLGPDECLCDYCSAKCCKYFALPIDTPTTEGDFDYIRWYLLHDRATVFVDDGTWYILVHTTCRHLQADNRCGIYMTRPQICREYSTDNCEYDETWTYEQYFELPEQITEYVEATIPRKKKIGIRSAKPEELPLL